MSFWYSELSTGNSPQNTTGLLGLNPERGFSKGSLESHIVSPTLVSDKLFIPVIMNPISPALNSSIYFAFGVKTPTFSISYSF